MGSKMSKCVGLSASFTRGFAHQSLWFQLKQGSCQHQTGTCYIIIHLEISIRINPLNDVTTQIRKSSADRPLDRAAIANVELPLALSERVSPWVIDMDSTRGRSQIKAQDIAIGEGIGMPWSVESCTSSTPSSVTVHFRTYTGLKGI